MADYLLGMREVVALPSGELGPGAHHPLPSAAAGRGDHFMAGLTIGPERCDAGGVGPTAGVGADLTGTVTAIRFGGTAAASGCDGAPCEVVANAATKYVSRPAGVTGVFNTDAAPTPVQAYGYDLQLDRFAFRQVSNALDPASWMEGYVDLPAPGGFRVVFDSLDLDCTGALGEAVVPPCADAGDPEAVNCDEALGAWHAPIGLLSMRFVPPDGAAACFSGSRTLSIGMSVDAHALDDPLGLTATWSPAGEPLEARVTGATDHVLDRPGPPSQAAGFPVAVGGEAVLGWQGADGWFQLDAVLAVPFWDAMVADLKLANADLAHPAPSVVAPANAVTDWAAASAGDGWEHTAHYRWGATGFTLDLPVTYAADPAAASGRASTAAR